MSLSHNHRTQKLADTASPHCVGECKDGLVCVTADQDDLGPAGGLLIGGGGGPAQIGVCTADDGSHTTDIAGGGGGDSNQGGCGGCSEGETEIDAETLMAAKAAVGLIDARSNNMYASQFYEIHGEPDDQVVAGTRYTMDVDAAQTLCMNDDSHRPDGIVLDGDACPPSIGASIQRYHVDIVFTPWMDPQYNLMSFSPVSGNHGTVQASHSGPAAPQVHSGRECDDGTTQMCMVMVMCPEGTLSAVKNECTACVDPVSCCSDGDSDCEAAFQAQSKGH